MTTTPAKAEAPTAVKKKCVLALTPGNGQKVPELKFEVKNAGKTPHKPVSDIHTAFSPGMRLDRIPRTEQFNVSKSHDDMFVQRLKQWHPCVWLLVLV